MQHRATRATNATIKQTMQLKLLENVTMYMGRKPFANIYRHPCSDTTVRGTATIAPYNVLGVDKHKNKPNQTNCKSVPARAVPGKNAAETVEVVDLGLDCKMLLDKMQNVNASIKFCKM